MNRVKTIGAAIFIFAAVFSLFNFVNALISSDAYRILMVENPNIGIGRKKSAGPYSLMGTSGRLGVSALTGGSYSVQPGVLNSWRPPQDDVNTMYVYPNPCNRKKGCMGVVFTRLTLNARIKIYTVSGERLKTIIKDTTTDSIGWNLKTEDGRYVASGLYVYYVEGNNSNKTGKIVIIR